MGMLTQLLPVCLFHLHAEVFGGVFDSVECLLALLVRDTLYLVEAGDGVTDMGGVLKRFFALVGEGVLGFVDFLAAFGGEGVGFRWNGSVAPGTDVRRYRRPP